MGENTPLIGEPVVYHGVNGPVIAYVVAVTFWDLVDLELEDGTVLKGIRRVVVMDVEGSTQGRFERL